MKTKKKLTPRNRPDYKSSGVNIDAGNDLVDQIRPLVKATERLGSMSDLGGFGALFDLKAAGFRDPILVAAADGVGTKLKIAVETGELSTIGIDLVAMCVNDLICQGAVPLFFLDYFATAKLNLTEATTIIKGIAKGCRLSNMALIGGETAEMPGIYRRGDFDLAGFAVGAVNRGETLPKRVKSGDIIISLHSSGCHSNGFSFIRMIIKNLGLSWQSIAPFSDKELGIELLKPTKIYTKPVIELNKKKFLKGVAHITGGGLTENIPRILGRSNGARINLNSIALPEIFKWLFAESKISQTEALKIFNCGTGMIIVVQKNNVEEVQSLLKYYHQTNSIIGEITAEPGVTYTGNLIK